MRTTATAVLAALALSHAATAQTGTALQPKAEPKAPASAPPADDLNWRTAEAPFLSHHVELTKRDDFVKAGEAYFNRGMTWIVFQAIPVPAAGQAADDFYSIYAAKLVKSDAGDITGIEKPILLSPPGSWNSCGWFNPKTPWEVMFSSTLTRPKEHQKAGFNVGSRKYTWLFPEEADIVGVVVPEIFSDISHKPVPGTRNGPVAMRPPQTMLSLPDYQAECSLSPDGRFLLYAGARKDSGGREDIDIYVHDLRDGGTHLLVGAPGYDGGPFFSADGKKICYRSDRHGDDLLQIYTADLRFDKDGVPVGITREIQLTDNGAVNWAPYWHPRGDYLVYGSSEMGHQNYEIYAVETDPDKSVTDRRRVRVTRAAGADVLPVFSADGSYMMWTAQRGPLGGGDEKPSSQLWAARVTGSPFDHR
ncbi:MAG: PD40 domain-containing protein [Phycisphaerales bacterium]|nr:PD40 domain-containing protein [Phycisphaerales bacterium]